MDTNHVSVSTQITLNEIPVVVEGLYWPDQDEVTNITAKVAESNPNSGSGLWAVEIHGDRVHLFEDGRIPGVMFTDFEDKIDQAAKEAVPQELRE